MFHYVTNHHRKKALMNIKNSQNLTPINLAAKLGRKEVFSKLLELQSLVKSVFLIKGCFL